MEPQEFQGTLKRPSVSNTFSTPFPVEPQTAYYEASRHEYNSETTNHREGFAVHHNQISSRPARFSPPFKCVLPSMRHLPEPSSLSIESTNMHVIRPNQTSDRENRNLGSNCRLPGLGDLGRLRIPDDCRRLKCIQEHVDPQYHNPSARRRSSDLKTLQTRFDGREVDFERSASMERNHSTGSAPDPTRYNGSDPANYCLEPDKNNQAKKFGSRKQSNDSHFSAFIANQDVSPWFADWLRNSLSYEEGRRISGCSIMDGLELQPGFGQISPVRFEHGVTNQNSAKEPVQSVNELKLHGDVHDAYLPPITLLSSRSPSFSPLSPNISPQSPTYSPVSTDISPQSLENVVTISTTSPPTTAYHPISAEIFNHEPSHLPIAPTALSISQPYSPVSPDISGCASNLLQSSSKTSAYGPAQAPVSIQNSHERPILSPKATMQAVFRAPALKEMLDHVAKSSISLPKISTCTPAYAPVAPKIPELSHSLAPASRNGSWPSPERPLNVPEFSQSQLSQCFPGALLNSTYPEFDPALLSTQNLYAETGSRRSDTKPQELDIERDLDRCAAQGLLSMSHSCRTSTMSAQSFSQHTVPPDYKAMAPPTLRQHEQSSDSCSTDSKLDSGLIDPDHFKSHCWHDSDLTCIHETEDRERGQSELMLQERRRKIVSHFFGRNKVCTLKMADPAWVYHCRKHYQRTRYRSDGYALQQSSQIRLQLAKFDMYRPGMTYDVIVSKKLNRWYHNSLEALNKGAGLKDKDDGDRGDNRVFHRAAFDFFTIQLKPLCVANSTMGNVLQICTVVEEALGRGILNEFPLLEFLPNEKSLDEALIRAQQIRARRKTNGQRVYDSIMPLLRP